MIDAVIGVRILRPEGQVPVRAHATDAAFDVHAAEEILLLPRQWRTIKTAIAFDIPVGWEVQVRPRSSLPSRHGVTVGNSPGTIDAGYQGEVGITLINHGIDPYRVAVGDRIAQLVVARIPEVAFRVTVDEPEASERGTQGFGSTG